LCGEVVTEVLDPRCGLVGIRRDADGDHRFEVAIVLDARDFEARYGRCMHVCVLLR
jgi:hypothetical protein